MPVLSSYITDTRRLLHDANGTQYSDAELTENINTGRKHVALDTACLRSLETVTLNAAQETYSVQAVTSLLTRAIDVVNITVLWGNQRVPLIQMVWSEFNANLRVWSNFQNMPACYSKYGGPLGPIYIGPVPNTTYTSYWDVFYTPTDLVDDTTIDPLNYPFSEPVPYYAAYVAKFKQQAYGEAALYQEQYKQKAYWVINSTFTRVMPNVYAYPQRSW